MVQSLSENRLMKGAGNTEPRPRQGSCNSLFVVRFPGIAIFHRRPVRPDLTVEPPNRQTWLPSPELALGTQSTAGLRNRGADRPLEPQYSEAPTHRHGLGRREILACRIHLRERAPHNGEG